MTLFSKKKILLKLASFKERPGFTLAELITSLIVITIITALFLANYNQANKKTDLTLAAQNLVADIHLAQSQALGMVEFDGASPPGGWGIHLSSVEGGTGSYIIFADLNENQSYDEGEADISAGGRVIDLPATIEVSDLSLGPNLDITFLPPDPITSIYNGTATATEATITLTETRSNNIKTVRLNFLGLAEVIN